MEKITKTGVLFFLSFVISIIGFSQPSQTTKAKLDGCENFDALTVGDGVCEQLGGMWGCSWVPGSDNDAIVSNLFSQSPSNSMLVEDDADIWMSSDVNNLTSGKWTYSHFVFIPDGKTGYWNLQKYVYPGIEWGFQVMYDDDMTMIVDAGAPAAAIIPYDYDTWYLNEVIVDLDNDWCEFFINGDYILGYQWSLGTFGTPGENSLGLVGFYANPGTGGTPAGAHFDDVCFEEYQNPNCQNFDNLQVGLGVYEQLGGMWTTWSGMPGMEDALVTDVVSNSPNNSFVVD